ncbi:MAG: radical SAM protein [Clostridia bacterium]|nr:radical SAM protein [Clostridia bacterium]
MKSNFLFIWADSGLSTKSNHVNAPYHFIHLGEVVDYITKKLKQKIDILDIEAEQTEFQDIITKIIQNQYEAIAFYTNTENLQNTIKLQEYIKEILPNCKTIAYGEMPIYLPKFFKKTQFNAIVARECDQEVAIYDFFMYSIDQKKEEDMRGVLLIKDKQLVQCKKGELIEANEWGFTNISDVPVEEYFKMEKKKQVVLTIARGCPFNCPYCNAVLYYGKKERRRPVEDIIKYINSSDYKYYKFFAPDFTLNEEKAAELCNAILNNPKRIKWSCTTRPDLLENEDLIKVMAKSGCYKIAIGIESIEKHDLESINKRYNQEVIIKGIQLLKKYNIQYKALVMFGVPNQTKENIKYTLDFLNKYDVNIRPTAYTPFYEMNHNMNTEQIAKYDKRTYYEGIPKLSYADFLKLIYDTNNYKNILK